MKNLFVFIFCCLQSFSLGAACANQAQPTLISVTSRTNLTMPTIQMPKPVKKKAIRKKEIDYKKLIKIGKWLMITSIPFIIISAFLSVVVFLEIIIHTIATKGTGGGYWSSNAVWLAITGTIAFITFWGGLGLILFAVIKRAIDRKRKKNQHL